MLHDLQPRVMPAEVGIVGARDVMPLGDDMAESGLRPEPRAGRDGMRYVRRETPLVSSRTHLTGRCANDLFCMAAIRKDDVVVLPGNPFLCPSCQKPLVPLGGKAAGPRLSRKRHAMPLVTDGAFLRGRCLNRKCSVARRENDICVRLGNVFVCPECSRPLSARPDIGKRVLTPLVCSIGAGLLLLGTSAAVVAMQTGNQPPPQATLSTAAYVPDGLAAPKSMTAYLTPRPTHPHTRRRQG